MVVEAGAYDDNDNGEGDAEEEGDIEEKNKNERVNDSDSYSHGHSDESVHIISTNTKKLQTTNCVKKNKAVQTDVSKVMKNKLKSKNSRNSKLYEKNQKKYKSQLVEPLHNENAKSNINIDLIEDELTTPKNSDPVSEINVLWSQSNNRNSESTKNLSKIQANNFTGELSMFPSLPKNGSRTSTAKKLVLTSLPVSRGNQSEFPQQPSKSKFSVIDDLQEDKTARLQSIYSEAGNLPGLRNYLSPKRDTGERISKSKVMGERHKSSMKLLIKNATARN